MWLLSTRGSTFTADPLALALVDLHVGNGGPLVGIQGHIDDVNDALADVRMDLPATLDGLTPATITDTTHILADDFGQNGFCSCDDLPGTDPAPAASCNRYDYANQTVIVLNCVGEKRTVRLPTTHGRWHYGDRPLTEMEDADGDGTRDISHSNAYIVEETAQVEDDRSEWDAATWPTGAGGFGLLGMDSPCPHYTGARTHTDISRLDVRRLTLRSWFYVPVGVISLLVRVTSDQPAQLYVNTDLAGEHTPAEGGDGCPSSTDHSLYLWYAPDGAHDDLDNYKNEISLVAHTNVTFVDVEILAVQCENQLSCGQDTVCATGRPCGPSCTCSIDLGKPTSIVHFASTSIASGVCVPNRCGDGTVQEPWEECDDGNTIDSDTCSNKCRLNLNEGNCRVEQLSYEAMLQEYTQLQDAYRDAIAAGDQALVKQLLEKRDVSR